MRRVVVDALVRHFIILINKIKINTYPNHPFVGNLRDHLVVLEFGRLTYYMSTKGDFQRETVLTTVIYYRISNNTCGYFKLTLSDSIVNYPIWTTCFKYLSKLLR